MIGNSIIERGKGAILVELLLHKKMYIMQSTVVQYGICIATENS